MGVTSGEMNDYTMHNWRYLDSYRIYFNFALHTYNLSIDNNMLKQLNLFDSTQGVLPPTPPYLGALPPTHFPPHPSTQNGHSDSPQNSSEQPGDEASPARGRTDGAASPPPGPAMSGHPGHPPVMAPYSWGHAAYPIYHIYPHDGVGPGIDRAGSPPAVFPAGGSPPLGPGFISVPVHGSMGGSSPPGHPGMMYGGSPPHSLGSSPPGGHHYLYMPPPAHYPHALGGPVEMQHRMSAMSINSPEGVSPRASSGTSSAGGRKESTRASARIARSHRAGGAYNPSDFEFKVEEGEDAGRTTVMIRNIPNKYNQSIMLALLEEAGLKGTFDFFYLPIDFRNRCGLGYAFVNFLTHGDAVRAYKHFHQRRWDEFNSKKVCEITYGRVQGRDSLVQHFKSAKFPSSDAEYCPLVFSCSGGENGEPLEAHSPLPIHEYLEVTEGKEEETE